MYELCNNCLKWYNQIWHTWCPDCGKDGELYGHLEKKCQAEGEKKND